MSDPADKLAIGVVIERRKIANKWIDHIDTVIDVIPGAPPVDAWRLLVADEGWERYHAATLDLELYRDQAEGYRANLGTNEPKLFVVLRRDESDSTEDFFVYCVTACPFEAAKFMDVGDDIVEAVQMPEGIAAAVKEFADEHYVERVFVKRQRKPYDPRKDFGADAARRKKNDS